MDTSRLLLKLALRVTGTLDLQEVLDEGLRSLRRLLEFGGGAIQLVEDGALVAAATDPPMSAEARTVRIPVGEGVSGRIAASGEPIYIPDIARDPRVHPQGRKKGVSAGVRSYFGAPLIARGHPIGVVQIDSPTVDAFGPHDQALVLSFLPTISAAVQNARLYAQEREALKQLRETERMKRDFLSLISHELKTPLTSIVGFAETLGHFATELRPEVVEELARRIRGASQRLERLIEDLLDLARIERKGLRVEPQPTDLEPVVRQVAIESATGDRAVLSEIPPGLPRVLADPDRLHQVLANLVGNAVKFSPPGAPIRIEAAPEEDRVAIRVIDRGPGIPEQMRERVFEPFVQLEDSATRAHGGMGIGLFIVRQIVRALGGEVELRSAPGKGSTFTVRLPAVEALDGAPKPG